MINQDYMILRNSVICKHIVHGFRSMLPFSFNGGIKDKGPAGPLVHQPLDAKFRRRFMPPNFYGFTPRLPTRA